MLGILNSFFIWCAKWWDIFVTIRRKLFLNNNFFIFYIRSQKNIVYGHHIIFIYKGPHSVSAYNEKYVLRQMPAPLFFRFTHPESNVSVFGSANHYLLIIRHKNVSLYEFELAFNHIRFSLKGIGS